MRILVWRLRHIYYPRLQKWWHANPSLTRFLPRWANKRLQKWGEDRRSGKARLEPETNLPFPYNDGFYLESYNINRVIAENDAAVEEYWKAQQRHIDNSYCYRNHPGPRFALAIEEPQ